MFKNFFQILALDKFRLQQLSRFFKSGHLITKRPRVYNKLKYHITFKLLFEQSAWPRS